MSLICFYIADALCAHCAAVFLLEYLYVYVPFLNFNDVEAFKFNCSAKCAPVWTLDARLVDYFLLITQ